MRGEKNAESAGEVPSAGALIVRAATSQPERKASARSCLPGSFAVRPQWSMGEPRQAARRIRRYGRVGASSDPSGCAGF